uniref:Ring finger protein 213 n=1 Tax=Varanus komodoensis TaxID=61221 RepID=A0A8D2LQW6_VARKO
METGQMVVLLNLQNLYESLYDALNQYYVQLAGQKYVDLGLGTHRVKCRVHPEFRLIVIEEKEVVYKHFPIPLINRLEKHYLDINSVLEKWQRDIVKELKKWVDNFRAVNTEKHLMGQQKYTPSDVFVGYHSDTCASVVLQVTEELKTGISSQELIQKVEEQAKLVLLNCATPDSVIRLGDSCLGSILAHQLAALYFQQQQHACLADFLHACLDRESRNRTVFTEITTFSRLLTAADTETFQKEMCCDMDNLKVLFLHQFDTEHSFLKEIRATPGRKILIVQTDFENGPLSAQLVASAKYSAVNEINKIDLNDASVFVFFITKLSRVKGGSSYVGFHGGLWQSVHIDDLRRSKDIVSDVSALRNITISELFSEDKGKSVENHNFIATPMSPCNLASHKMTNILDSTLLLKSCVQSAVGMLRDQNEIASRSTKRIEILLSLLSEEDDLKGSFLKITKKRLSDLLMKQEESVYTMKQWVLQEASNLNALQEAGTFRHTLWKRVQRAVTPLLAYMLSVLDRDCNLDLLVNPVIENCVKDLWMYIFTGKDGNDHAKKFVNIFQQTALGKYIATLSEEEQNTLFHCYSRDFILLTMGVTSYKELHLLRMALISCIEEIKPASSTAEDGVLPLPWIHLGYHQFRNRLQNFTRILAVYPDVFDALDKHVLDVLSALACTEMLQEKLLNCSPEAWLQQVKNLQMPIELVCSVNYLHHNGGQCEQLLQEVRSQWNRVFSVSLFVEHVLLEAETSISGVQDLVKKYTVQLGKCFQWNSDIKSHKTFTAVMEVLRQCKEAVSLIFCRYGLKPCPICMGDPTEPVNLPCDHVYCHSCIKVWLVPERMQCPLCLTKVPEDYTPTVSKELSIAIGKNAQFRKCCNSFFIDLVSTMCFKDNEPPEKAVIQELLNLLFVHAKYLRGSAESDVHTKSLSPFDDVVDKTPVIRSMVLKLLLKYSFSDVKVYIKEYLSQVETSHLLDNEDKVELYVLFVNCFEVCIFLILLSLESSHTTLFSICSNPELHILCFQRQKLGQIDRFLVYGRNYRMLRDAMGKAMIESQTHNLAAICDGSKSGQAVHFLLAVFQELTSLYGCKDQSLQPKQEQCDILKEFIQNSRVLPSSEWEAFANYLVTNSLPSLSLSAQDSSHKRVVIEMAVHTAAVLLSGQNQLLVPLRNLAFSPNTMQNAFLPTMPEDLLAQAVKWEATVGLHWYTCPNGHPCAIGECGRPMQQGRCVDCGAAIGGENHRALPTFQKAHIGNDRTQTGHVLGDPGKRVVEVAPEREMPPAALILIRLLTHLALLLGATKNPQSLLQIIKPEVQDPVSFFLQHIRKDIEQLMNTLGKSADDTANVVHLILCRLLKEIQDQGKESRLPDALSKREHRNNWERLVAQTVILPELKLDKTLLELNQEISTDERLSSNPLVKLIYGDPATFLSRLPKNSIVHCSRMWSCRKSISVQYLSHIVQQKGGKEPVPILWKFLQKEAELRLVKFLPEILALQKDLVKRFQNISEVEYRTIEDFLNNLPSGGMKHLMMNRVKIFLNVWNKLRSSLETSGEIKLPKGYCDNDLTVQNEFEIILPRRQGLGLCSTALSSYLIALHNDFVTSIEKETYSVSPTEVTDLHVIAYEVERDLIPLILSNCQYSLEKGGEAVQEFDLAKIQQQLIRRFLQGKPLITLKGMPTLMYRHDRNYEHLFSELKSKLSQSSLPNSTISTISGELQSYSDICEALSVTEITLGFLAMAGGDPEMTLTEYMENILQMGSQTSAHVLKVSALSRCQLKHTIALWQLIASHKSEQLLHLKRDPFAEVSASYKHKLTMESTKLLTAFLVQAGMESFLQELHEMILLKLKHPQEEFNPVWSLKDTFISYLEQKDSKMLEEIENMFPEEILLSQCIDAWKLAATLKRNRRLG